LLTTSSFSSSEKNFQLVFQQESELTLTSKESNFDFFWSCRYMYLLKNKDTVI
jgi:hypothetical protein